jgi:hypothetical protein
MLHGDVARYRTEDLMRTAETRRASRAAHERHRAVRRSMVRRVVTTATALLPIPVRH